MGLDSGADAASDLIRATYSQLRNWYQANAQTLLDSAPPASRRAESIVKSLPVIDALPPESDLTDLEIRVVFFEVVYGVLAWSYWDKIGDRSVYELVASTLQQAGYPRDIGDANKKAFRESDSKLRPLFSGL